MRSIKYRFLKVLLANLGHGRIEMERAWNIQALSFFEPSLGKLMLMPKWEIQFRVRKFFNSRLFETSRKVTRTCPTLTRSSRRRSRSSHRREKPGSWRTPTRYSLETFRTWQTGAEDRSDEREWLQQSLATKNKFWQNWPQCHLWFLFTS